MITFNSIVVHASNYGTVVLNNVPYYPQKVKYDCGISSLSMMEAAALGYGINEYDDIYNTILAANGNSLDPSGVMCGKYIDITKNLESLYNEVANGRPVMIYRTGGKGNHWSVVYGYNC